MMKSIYYFLLMLKLYLCSTTLFAVLPYQNKVYVSFPGTIAVYDIDKENFTKSIQIPDLKAPDLALNLTGTKLYALTSFNTSNYITIYDTTTFKAKKISFFNGIGIPDSIAFTKDFAYINVLDNGDVRRVVVFVLDVNTDEIRDQIVITQTNRFSTNGISIPPDGNRAFVGISNGEKNRIVELAIPENVIVEPTINFNSPNIISLIAAPNVSKIFVGRNPSILSVFNPNDQKHSNQRIPNNFLQYFVANTSKDVNRIYAAGDGPLLVINTIDNSIKEINIKTETLAINPENTRLYTANFLTSPYVNIFRINESGDLVIPPRSFLAGTGARGLAAGPESPSDKVVVLPPHKLRGEVIKNKFLTQTDIVNFLTWKASLDDTVTSYNVYRDGELIGTVLATSRLEFVDHNRRDDKTYVYEVVAANSDGVLSSPVTIELKD
ncbi:MAG: hypothetical protein H0W88_02935 [Parachlamydiaceae bacterium]|nr:hypothetical protein [Parachlamydiaceae bacterium]